MNSLQFVASLIDQVQDAAVEDTLRQLERPAGRRPPEKSLRLANWYARLEQEDKAGVRDVIERAVHSALFGALCVIDGVRAVQDDPRHEFRLVSVTEGDETLLNPPDGEALHDVYQGLTHERIFE